jgi:hypothetical protein
MDDKYRSRRYLITLLCILSGVALAYFGKMDANIALILTGGMASYNLKDSFKK